MHCGRHLLGFVYFSRFVLVKLTSNRNNTFWITFLKRKCLYDITQSKLLSDFISWNMYCKNVVFTCLKE